MTPYMKNTRNRDKKYNIRLVTRVSDQHQVVLEQAMERYGVNKSEANRMAINALALQMLDEEYRD